MVLWNFQLPENPLQWVIAIVKTCLLYTSDAADDMQCVDLGGRRIIKKTAETLTYRNFQTNNPKYESRVFLRVFF